MSLEELSLLDSTWRRPADENLSPAQKLSQLAVQGSFVEVLTSDICQNLSLFALRGDAIEIQWPNHSQSAETELAVLSITVALLQAFLQTNWTGPEISLEPADLFATKPDPLRLNVDAIEQLTLLGEPAYHLTRKAAFFLAAKLLLESKEWAHTPTLPLWQLRCAIIHIRLLDEPIPLEEGLLATSGEVRDQLLANEADLAAGVHITLGLYHNLVSRSQPYNDRQASECFHAAATRAGFEYELTGRLGKRTRFQVQALSQLVVLARSRDREQWQPREKRLQTRMNGIEGRDEVEKPKTLALNDDTLLEKTHFTSSLPPLAEAQGSLSAIDPSDQPALHPLDQCILLGLSLNIGNSAPAHGLTSQQVGAFVNRVLEDAENWSVHTMALLLRSRIEAARSRTVERGLLQMQSIIDQMKLAGSSDLSELASPERGAESVERLAFIHSLSLPSRWELEAELARRYRGLGVVRSALEIYERLELWEDAALCHAAAGRKDRAVALIRDLLEGRKTDADLNTPSARKAIPRKARAAKLWCTLGDLEGGTEHYAKAWEVSGSTSSRAMRGLGAHHYKAGEFIQASNCLRKALAINPLFMRAWFMLGCAAIQTSEWLVAEQAFSRCTALDDEDGESWSNLATVHLRVAENLTKAGDREAAYLRKGTAHNCLKVAVKQNYESWRMWQNYLTSSLAVGDMLEGVRALSRIIDLRAVKGGPEEADLDALDRLVDTAAGRSIGATISDADLHNLQQALIPRLHDLFVKHILPSISDSPRIWRANARLLLIRNDARGSLAAHLSAYRVGPAQSPAAQHDPKVFQEACIAIQETIDALETLGNREQDGQPVCVDWRYQARTILRAFLGRTKGSFEDSAEYGRLKEAMNALRS